MTPLLNAILNASIFRVKPRRARSDHLADREPAARRGRERQRAGLVRRDAALGRRRPAQPRARARGKENRRARRGARADRAPARRRERTRTRARASSRTSGATSSSLVGSVAWVDLTGQTPFLRAAAAGDLDGHARCCSSTARIRTSRPYAGTTPLMVAAGVNWAVARDVRRRAGRMLEAVKLTHELGNDVNAVNSMGIAAIHGAANRGAERRDRVSRSERRAARRRPTRRAARRSTGPRVCSSRRIRPSANPRRSRLLERLQKREAAEATTAR